MNSAAGNHPASDEGLGLRVPLKGDLDLRDAAEVAASLREAIAAFDPVEIDVAGLTGLDIGIAQLLLAAKKSAERQGKTLVLTGGLTASCRDILAAAGLLGPDGTPRSSAEAFWLTQSAHRLEVGR